MNKEQVKEGVTKWISWWINQRKKKLSEQLSDTMSVNPFLLPIIFDLHNITSFSELNDLTIGSHLMTGHNTGFGKLIDEKILPDVFKTIKLDKSHRSSNEPFHLSCFDEIDHLVARPDGKLAMLSLKAGRWTIQLTMAVQLNRAFKEINDNFSNDFSEIAVGVFYGKSDSLTDKYDILRGINRGANHDVIDLTHKVNVYAGREFWSWLNKDIDETQEWVLEGILESLKINHSREECGLLLSQFKNKIVQGYSQYIDQDGNMDWSAILKKING